MPRGLVAAVLLGLVLVQPGSTAGVREGGIFRVSFESGPTSFDHVDPALAYSRESWALLDTVCARLVRYRDRPPPQGYTLVPEVAAALPEVSADGRTHTFRLRRGFRFSDGKPVRADAFAQAIHRTLAPGVDSPAYLYTQAIEGAADVRAGRAQRASGVVASGYTLTVRFTREVRGFAAWTTMPFFCAVPPALPPSPEGVRSFPAPARTSSRATVPVRESSFGRTATTAALGHTTSTATTSTSPPTLPARFSTGSRPARQTGATRSPRSISTPAARSSSSTGRRDGSS